MIVATREVCNNCGCEHKIKQQRSNMYRHTKSRFVCRHCGRLWVAEGEVSKRLTKRSRKQRRENLEDF